MLAVGKHIIIKRKEAEPTSGLVFDQGYSTGEVVSVQHPQENVVYIRQGDIVAYKGEGVSIGEGKHCITIDQIMFVEAKDA